MGHLTDKAMIAAFYRELCKGKKTTKEYADQAVGRLAILLQRFRVKNKSFPGPVQEPWEFFSYYAELNWFPGHKKMLEGLPDNMLIGKIDMEFEAFLEDQQKKVRPFVDPNEIPSTEEELVVNVPAPHEVKVRKEPGGHYSVDGLRADHQHVKTVLGFRKQTNEEKASDRREEKKELKSLRSLRKDPVSKWLRKRRIRNLEKEVEHQHDPEQKAEEAWRVSDEINKAIREALEKKGFSKK